MAKIKKISDLTLEQAKEIALRSQYATIIVHDPSTQDESRIYNAEQLYRTKLAIEEFFSDMPEYDANDPNREMKIFTFIYTKLSKMITYDDFASRAAESSGYDLDRAYDLLNEAACAYGGLVKHRALCSGYSDTLLVLLESQNIKAKIISGGPKTRGEALRTGAGSHAWNQVCLDGVWYNCDLTNDCDFIRQGLQAPYFLKSNEDFPRYQKFPPKNPQMVEEAIVSVSPEQQEQLVTSAREAMAEKARQQQEAEAAAAETEKPGFIKWVMSLFTRNKGKGQER